jgi:hypothetical protein
MVTQRNKKCMHYLDFCGLPTQTRELREDREDSGYMERIWSAKGLVCGGSEGIGEGDWPHAENAKEGEPLEMQVD